MKKHNFKLDPMDTFRAVMLKGIDNTEYDFLIEGCVISVNDKDKQIIVTSSEEKLAEIMEKYKTN
jgi:hypothetical protein